MRLINLEVENFGIFTRRQFEFGDGRLSLVYGANETGKSTLLQLLRETLFGFPHRDSIPMATGSIMARATIEVRDGSLLAWHRRKGRINTLSGHRLESGQIWDESQLVELLCGANAELYQHVFAFSLAELQLGEKSLQAAKLSEALYGGGVGGLAAFQQIEAIIEQRLARLYAPRGTRRIINDRLQKVRECSRELKEAAVKPSAYEQLAREHNHWQQQRQSRAERSEQLGEQLRQLERRAQIRPARSRRDALLTQLKALQLPTGVNVQQIPQLYQATVQLASIEQQQLDLERQRSSRRARRAQIELVEPLLASADQVLSLYADLHRIGGFRRDMPLRAEEARSIEEDIDRQLTRWKPAWNREFLRQLPAGQAELKTVREMMTLLNRVDREQSAAEGARRAHLQQTKESQARLAGLATPSVPAELPRLVEHADEYSALLEARQRLADQQRRVSEKANARRRSLEQTISQSLPALLSINCPTLKTVAAIEEKWCQSERATTSAEQLLQSVEKSLTECQQALENLTSAGIPTKKELYTARARRDQIWAKLQAFFDAPALDSSKLRRQFDDYARANAECDNLADRLLAAATVVAQQEACSERAASLQQEFDTARARLDARQSEQKQLIDQWRELWRPATIEPLAPAAMMDWLREFVEACDLERELQQLQQQDQALEEKCAALNELLANCGLIRPCSESQAMRPGELLAKLKEAKQQFNESRRIESERRQLEQTISSSLREQEKIEQQLGEINDKRAAWQTRWQKMLTSWQLPADWTPAVADEALSELFELKERWNSAYALRERARDMQREIDGFASAATQLCQRIAMDLLDEQPEAAVRTLFQRIDQMRANSRLATELDDELLRLETHLNSAAKEHDRLVGSLAPLLGDLKSSGDRIDWLPKLRTANELWTDLRATEELLASLGDIANEDDSGDAVGNEPADLEAQCTLLREALQEAEVEYERALKQSILLAKQLEDLDTSSRTNELALELEQHHAELQTAVNQWGPLILASALMTQCLERFERERQPRLLQLATDLFHQMTEGRYVEIHRRLGEGPPMLVVRQYDGQEKDPSQLSTGTREQLYLAIRLAYVMQYCEDAEPLPVVMDDVLVNFDARRARLTLEVLEKVSKSVQILLMTCHESTARMVLQCLPHVTRVDLGEPLTDCEPRPTTVVARKRSRMTSAAATNDPQRPLFPPQS